MFDRLIPEFKPVTPELARKAAEAKIYSGVLLKPRLEIELLHRPFKDIMAESSDTGWRVKYLDGDQKPVIIEEVDLIEYFEQDGDYLFKGLINTGVVMPESVFPVTETKMAIIRVGREALDGTLTQKRITDLPPWDQPSGTDRI